MAFWTSMLVWTIFHVIIITFKFPWTAHEYYVISCVDSFLRFLPLGLIMMVISEMLFTYRSPGVMQRQFSFLLFFLLLVAVLYMGVLVLYDESKTFYEPDNTILLWKTVIDLTVACLIAFPGVKLLQAVKYPVLQPDDVPCVMWSSVCIGSLFVILVVHAIYDFLLFLGQNTISEGFKERVESAIDPLDMGTYVRVYRFFGDLFEGVVPGFLAIISVWRLRCHDLAFADDPFYAQKSDLTPY